MTRTRGRSWLGTSQRAMILVVSAAAVTRTSAEVPNCYEGYTQAAFASSFGTSGCPAGCNYKNVCVAASALQCVGAGDCAFLQNGGRAVPGNESGDLDGSGRCLGCAIVGCKVCASESRCGVCEYGYDFLDGGQSCLYKQRVVIWVSVIPIVCVLVVWFVVDAVRAQCRPATNTTALRAGLMHRFRMKVRQPGVGHPIYPLSTTMHTKAILGPDLALFMNWFVLVGLIALYLMILAVVFRPDSIADGIEDLCVQLHATGMRHLEASFASSTSRTAILERRLSWRTASYRSPEVPNVKLWTGLSYVGSVLISFLYMWWQQRNRERLKSMGCVAPYLHKYAVEASGFPPDATDHIELYQYFSDVIRVLLSVEADHTIVEVSICYDYASKQVVVDALADEHLLVAEEAHAELRLQRSHQSHTSTGSAMVETATTLSEAEDKLLASACGEETVCEHEDGSASAGPFWVQLLGYIMLGSDFEVGPVRLQGYAMGRPALAPTKAWELLTKLPNSGTVVVVLRTTSLRSVLVQAGSLPVFFREVNRIKVRKLLEEPASMQWAAYARSTSYARRVVVSILAMSAVLVLWVLLYMPWASFTTTAFNDTSTTSWLVSNLTGMVIALGNAIVSSSVVFLTGYIGFKHQSKERLLQLLIIIPCVMLNVFCDIVVTVRTAYFKFNGDLPDDMELQLNHGLMLVQSELFNLLVPGYCIIPYLAEPWFTVLLPLWIGIWRVKADPRIRPEQAERLLAASDIDIVNPPLCDMIVITSTFLATFLAPGRYHWMLFGALLVFATLTYSVNRVRILRWQSTVNFSTAVLHYTECYLWGLPLAILAASFFHQFSEEFHTKFAYGFFSFVAQFAWHVLFVQYVLPSLPTFVGPSKFLTSEYEEVAAKVLPSYRNTNPVEVLLSNLRLTHRPVASDIAVQGVSQVPPFVHQKLVLFRLGHEHLQPNSPDNYEGFENEVGRYSDVSAQAKPPSRTKPRTSLHKLRILAGGKDEFEPVASNLYSGETVRPSTVGVGLERDGRNKHTTALQAPPNAPPRAPPRNYMDME